MAAAASPRRSTASAAGSSIIGCIAGVAGILLARDKARAILPYGPYLALGAALWLFGGRELTGWYFSQFHMVTMP